MARRRDDGTIRVGKKVVAVRAVGPIPEGTTGVVKVVDGLTWFRYWVKWETGEWSAWVGDDEVVRADRLDAYRAQQAAAAASAAAVAEAAESAASRPQDDGAGAGGEEAGEASGIPAHLLARSQAARARRASAG